MANEWKHPGSEASFDASKYGKRRGTDLSKINTDPKNSDLTKSKFDRLSDRLERGDLWFTDPSDAYAGKGFFVGFQHVPSEKKVAFKAFITQLNENFNSDWASENVFGRADGIHMYKNTTRSLSVSLMIPAATEGEGFENLAKVQKLVQFLYPAYTDIQGAQTIAQSPLIRLKMMNLFADRSGEDGNDFFPNSKGTFSDLKGDAASWDTGLLGVLKGLNVNQNIGNPDIGVFELSHGTIVPKLIEINFDFQVIHEHALGWNQNGNFSQRYFPYGVNSTDSGQNTRDEQAKTQAAGIKAFTDAYNTQRKEENGEPLPQQAQDNARASLAAGMGQALAPAGGIDALTSMTALATLGGAKDLVLGKNSPPPLKEYGRTGGEGFRTDNWANRSTTSKPWE